MNKKIIIAIIVGLVGISLLVNGYYNGKQESVEVNEVQNTTKNSTPSTTTKTTTSSTTTTTTANNYKQLQTTTKAVKTTKKATIKEVQKFNIKYNKQEIIDYIHQEVVRRWGEEQWEATYQIVLHESGFNPNNVNKTSGACGLFQANPCSKVIKHGYTKYYTDWKEQVRWGLDYITVHKRYGTPNKAWAYWKKHGNY